MKNGTKAVVLALAFIFACRTGAASQSLRYGAFAEVGAVNQTGVAQSRLGWGFGLSLDVPLRGRMHLALGLGYGLRGNRENIVSSNPAMESYLLRQGSHYLALDAGMGLGLFPKLNVVVGGYFGWQARSRRFGKAEYTANGVTVRNHSMSITTGLYHWYDFGVTAWVEYILSPRVGIGATFRQGLPDIWAVSLVPAPQRNQSLLFALRLRLNRLD